MKAEIISRGGITAKIIADSEIGGRRLTTMQLRYPRFIHSEFMTHRMFSRNASSSRAIPVEKMIEQVRAKPAMPIHWGENQPGMQARTEVDYEKRSDAIAFWRQLARGAAEDAEFLANQFSLHKQIANRVLEPFQFISVVVTATEWDNFFKLRMHPDAQPEFYELASAMYSIFNANTPDTLDEDEWHLPYVDLKAEFPNSEDIAKATFVSAARCARVSYLNHDKTQPNPEQDMKLAMKLAKAGHMSPFEHQARAFAQDTDSPTVVAPSGITHLDLNHELWSGNLRGWIQLRQVLDPMMELIKTIEYLAQTEGVIPLEKTAPS